MKFLTDFGDSAVLLPLSMVMLAWLLVARPIRSAIWWIVALALCGGVIGVLKIVFFACPPASDLDSPSGHTALSLLVYGALATIVTKETSLLWLRIAAIAAAAALILGIAWSRLDLQMHTSPEIAVGLVVGAATLGLFVFGYSPQPTGRRTLTPLFLVSVLTIALFHGRQITPENSLHALGAFLGIQSLACP